MAKKIKIDPNLPQKIWVKVRFGDSIEAKPEDFVKRRGYGSQNASVADLLERVSDLDSSEPKFDVDQMIAQLQEYKKNFGHKFERLEIRTEIQFYRYDEGHSTDAYLWGYRFETQEEVNKRIQEAQDKDVAYKAQRKAMLEQLKKEFGEK